MLSILKSIHVNNNANDVHLTNESRSQFPGWEGQTGWGWMEVAHIIVHVDDTAAGNKRLLFVKMDVHFFNSVFSLSTTIYISN